MSTTLSREATEAAKHFKAKLEFETGPYSVYESVTKNEPVKVVDLRDPASFAKGHVPKALNIQYEDLGKQLGQLNKDETTIVYCYNITCQLATKAALYLAEQGYKVKELVGGYDEYASTEAKMAKAASSCATTKGSSCG